MTTEILQQLGDRINQHKQKVYDDRKRASKGQPSLYEEGILAYTISELQWAYALMKDGGLEEPAAFKKKQKGKGLLGAFKKDKVKKTKQLVKSESKTCERCSKDNAVMEPDGTTQYCNACLIILRDEHTKEINELPELTESIKPQPTRRCYLCGSPHNELEKWRAHDVCAEKTQCKPPALL